MIPLADSVGVETLPDGEQLRRARAGDGPRLQEPVLMTKVCRGGLVLVRAVASKEGAGGATSEEMSVFGRASMGGSCDRVSGVAFPRGVLGGVTAPPTAYLVMGLLGIRAGSVWTTPGLPASQELLATSSTVRRASGSVHSRPDIKVTRL